MCKYSDFCLNSAHSDSWTKLALQSCADFHLLGLSTKYMLTFISLYPSVAINAVMSIHDQSVPTYDTRASLRHANDQEH